MGKLRREEIFGRGVGRAAEDDVTLERTRGTILRFPALRGGCAPVVKQLSPVIPCSRAPFKRSPSFHRPRRPGDLRARRYHSE